jgi:hypothetical protein
MSNLSFRSAPIEPRHGFIDTPADGRLAAQLHKYNPVIYLISAVIALLTALPAFAADECRSAATHEGLASAPYVQFSS